MLKRSLEKLTTARPLPGMEQPPARKVDRIPHDLLHRRRAARRAMIDARQEKNAIEHILTLPTDGETLHIVIDGRFEPCDFIPATRRLADPATIADLTITTLSFNVDNISTIVRGLEANKIGKVTLICSDYFAKMETTLFQLAKQELEGRGGRVLGLRTHCKIMLMEMTDGRHFTIEGSGNLRSCNSIEQFTITNDRDLLLFHRNWIENYINWRRE